MQARYANATSNKNSEALPVIIRMTEEQARQLLFDLEVLGVFNFETVDDLYDELKTLSDATNDFGIGHNR